MQRENFMPNNGGFDQRQFLLEEELAERWRISRRTLQRWRCDGRGPQFLRLGGRVVYRLEDIDRFEAAARRRPGGAA